MEEFLPFGSALASRQHARVVTEDANDCLPGCVFECETCGRQSPTLQALIGCHGTILLKPPRITGSYRSGLKSLPAKARPGCLPWPHTCDPTERGCPSEVRSRRRNHASRSEFDDLAHEDSDFDIRGITSGWHFPTFQSHGGHRLSHLELTPTVGGYSSGLRSFQAKARPHGSLECDVPTMWNVSGQGTSTMHNHVACGASPGGGSDSLAKDIVINIPEEGGSCVHSLDQTRHVHGFSRLAILGDPLFDVNVQGAFALGAFKTSNASSPAKDVLLYLLVFVYAFGFLSALGGKGFRSSKLGAIGSVAATLGFLMTMALLLL
ncbi:uncharacterized protein LOC130137662 [Syzygium oleosum]|uniref:uncharacterized protein LOC130137662 n=1 Tax=Syzygium oleosum TaxID=219896 RepID=UPI0024B895E9|nr:uncharacterized protein LOC130137662 [Syzygium oleosum]